MKKNFLTLIMALLILTTSSLTTVYAESITLTTYYPAPFGAYDQIQLVPRTDFIGGCINGRLYASNTSGILQYCQNGSWVPILGIWTQNGDNLYPTDFMNPNLKVGIGRNDPDNTLDINGSLEIEVDDNDSKLRFHDPGEYWYSMGIDRSDGGKFKINFGANIGDTNPISMAPNGDVEIGGTLTVQSNGKNKGLLKVQYIPGASAGYYATYAP